MIKEILDLTTSTDNVAIIEEIIDKDPEFIKEVIDLTKQSDPKPIKK